jgi:hypothetical protein
MESYDWVLVVFVSSKRVFEVNNTVFGELLSIKSYLDMHSTGNGNCGSLDTHLVRILLGWFDIHRGKSNLEIAHIFLSHVGYININIVLTFSGTAKW